MHDLRVNRLDSLSLPLVQKTRSGQLYGRLTRNLTCEVPVGDSSGYATTQASEVDKDIHFGAMF
jgi:hypothetical protein